jgi:hypothetical protein
VGAFRARQDDDVTMMLVRRTSGVAERGAGTARARLGAPLRS